MRASEQGQANNVGGFALSAASIPPGYWPAKMYFLHVPLADPGTLASILGEGHELQMREAEARGFTTRIVNEVSGMSPARKGTVKGCIVQLSDDEATEIARHLSPHFENVRCTKCFVRVRGRREEVWTWVV